MGSGLARQTSVESLRETLDHSKVIPVMAVGDPEEWKRQGHKLPQEKLVFVAFEDIDQATMEQFSPSIVLSPVLAHTFDCIELALLLRSLGFNGEYCAVARDLPKPALIEREVSQMCPSLNFRITVTT